MIYHSEEGTYFYPRPPGGGRQRHDQSTGSGRDISIHALRVEGDQFDYPVYIDLEISIHALRVEGDTLF